MDKAITPTLVFDVDDVQYHEIEHSGMELNNESELQATQTSVL